MENNEFYQTYPGSEFLLRKGRGKKKRKRNKNRLSAFNTTEDKSESETSNTVESVGDANLTDDGSGVEDTEDDAEKGDAVSLTKAERTLDRNNSRVSLDAMLYKPPLYEPGDIVNVKENTDLRTTESTDDKLAVEDEPVEENVGSCSLINTRALHKDSSTYELETFEKNALIIFNQEKIEGHLPRLGTDKDVESLTKTFENVGFEVTPHNDLKKDELFTELNTFFERDFTDYGCVAVAVLTHGSKNGLLRAKDQQYSEIEIINLFKDRTKTTLVTKPKLIIIQACRGTKIKAGVPVFHAGKTRKDLDEDLEPYILPVESDLLILHSSYVGSPSHRNEVYGSWFIQALCNKIDTLASSQDLESILTVVKREVAINKQHEEYNKRTFEMDVNKQMPVMTSTLIRKLYLRKFREKVKQETSTDQLSRPDVSRQRSQSRHEVLDTVATPMTPLLIQFGPCSCFLDHFAYMRTCLRYFVEENPTDETAQNFLEIANTFEDGVEFNTSKDKMSKAISKHLINNARSSYYYKYLYFYKHSQQPSGNK